MQNVMYIIRITVHQMLTSVENIRFAFDFFFASPFFHPKKSCLWTEEILHFLFGYFVHK